MRLRIDPTTRIERVVSIAVAIVATTAGAILVMSALISPSVPSIAHEQKPLSEHLAFLTAPLPSRVARARPASRPSSTGRSPNYALPQTLTKTLMRNEDSFESGTTEVISRSKPAVDVRVPDTSGHSILPQLSPLLSPNPVMNEKSIRTSGFSGGGPNGPAWATSSEFLRRHPPMSFDSALRAVHGDIAASIANAQLKRIPSTQAERDIQSRNDALADVAAKSAGRPTTHTLAGGGRVDAPLPFGGPSRKHRQRDSTINAQTIEMLARIRQRADSAEVMQQRKRDSLARIERSHQTDRDSLRGSPP
jgi:hypothetical protein